MINQETILLGEFTYNLSGADGGHRVEALDIEVAPFSERYDEDGDITSTGQADAARAYELIEQRRTALENNDRVLDLRWKENRDNAL